jgi:hypothetical protein
MFITQIAVFFAELSNSDINHISIKCYTLLLTFTTLSIFFYYKYKTKSHEYRKRT